MNVTGTGNFLGDKPEREIGAVRAKMQVNTLETTEHAHGSYKKVKLGCVYGKEGENADYSKATPSGECWMQIDAGTKAAGFFKPGKSYYVTFVEAL